VSRPTFLPYIRWLTLFALLGLILVAAPEPADTVAVTAFCQGEALAAATGDESRLEPASALSAEAAYRRAIARRPWDPQPWRRLGDLYLAWRRLDDAYHAYDQALRRGDTSTTLDQSLAQLYALQGHDRLAARYWTTYLTRRPDDHAARLALALAAVRLADWERARAELESLPEDDLAAQAWLGLLLLDPDPATGMPHLQRAAEDPGLAAFLAPVFEAQRLSAASDDPAYRLALLGLALLELAGPTESGPQRAAATLALRSLLAATHHDPSYADAYAYLGQALDRLGQPNWARAALDNALQLAPHSPVALTLAGLYWDRHGDSTQARQHYQAAYEQDPGNAVLCLEIAATYAAEGAYTAAETWLFQAVQADPDAPQVWEALAHYYLDTGVGVQESGLPVAARLLELAPQNAHAHDLLGWAYFLVQEDAQAQASLNQALALDPTLAPAHYHLGRLYARQGHYDAAAQAYRQAAVYDTRGQLAAQLERAWDELPPTYHDGNE
jgi:tetratricopeptide (TPR) repeat protein